MVIDTREIGILTPEKCRELMKKARNKEIDRFFADVEKEMKIACNNQEDGICIDTYQYNLDYEDFVAIKEEYSRRGFDVSWDESEDFRYLDITWWLPEEQQDFSCYFFHIVV